MPISRLTVVLLLLLGLATGAHAQGASPVGDWRTFDDRTGKERSLVRITETNGVLSGRILATTDPQEGRHVCEKCVDDRKNEPIIGLEFLRGMRADSREWSGGRILDPETGSVYHCEMHLEDGGRKLVLRGYIGISLFGRSQTWLRAG
jgi:uncharacterized protein (DUF2147 family)